MKHKVKTLKLAMFVFALAFFLILPSLKKSLAVNEIHEIYTFSDLVNAASLSRTSGHEDDTYILMANIEITEENQTELLNSDFKHISFGSTDLPFTGTFEGNGYSISNLKYESTLAAKSDTGLFASTGENASIKNLTIKNAEIRSDYRGGIIAGYAENTLFENIKIEDSHLFVAASNNVLTLVTDGGIRGGAIVGEAIDSVLYNCESNNTRVNTNNTSGVAALSGKGLTLGGLVGTASNTLVEYSRVIGGLVKNYYDVAVGALGGNTLYVGGIVGKMKNSSVIIDSFSTAELYYYCATYVSVGAGNAGHIGGVAAAMEGNQNEIIRSHYAGVATSRQYNAVLVIPIIQNNVNISGIVDVYEGGAITNSYFKSSLNPDVEMHVLGDDSSTSSYGPISDERYSSNNFWQTQSYDLTGTIKRTSTYSDNHYNKWVIDKELGIPIHGKSVSATLDFPNAGVVTIKETQLINKSVSTQNPYIFAVQGLEPNEYNINLSATENEGYKFISWYKIPNIAAWSLNESYDFFEDMFPKYSPISTEKDLINISANDNNLFVAYYKARVLFYDVNGEIIDRTTGNPVTMIRDEDWYDYNDEIPEVIPSNQPISANAKLIGWTTVRSNESGGSYSAITSPELTALKNNGAFYEVGDTITKSMNLYPVYVDSISNINTVFEGNEQDTLSDVSQRDGVGTTTVSLNDEDEVVISVTGVNVDGTFPTGYKFIGWYDESNVRISAEQELVLENIDLTISHTYTAKFEYLIEYYIKAFSQNDGDSFTDSTLYGSRWQKYNTTFVNIPSPGYLREYITHWGNEHINHGDTDNTSDSYSANIFGPLKVYSHNYETATGSATAYQTSMTTDFPGSGQIIDEKRSAGAKFRFTPTSDRYHLLFWTFERKRKGWTYVDNPMDTGILDPSVTYQGMAMVTTDIIFYKKNGDAKTVTRRYESNLFLDSDTSHTYKYPFMHQEDDVSTSPEDGSSLTKTITLQASPALTDMNIEGYAFLGWISTLDVVKDSDEWNYIYDVENDLYCTSDIEKAKPYLLSEDEIVLETFDVYPVYAKYNIITTTSVSHENISTEINTPNNPTYTLSESTSEKGIAMISLIPDSDTYVIGDSGEKYILTSFTRVYEDGTKEKILISDNNTYKYVIEAGPTYTFMANYEPFVLAYHLNDADIDLYTREYGEEIGQVPLPTNDISEFSAYQIFAGWTNIKPTTNSYHKFEDYLDFEASQIDLITQTTVVSESMELWPVYITVNISVNSNIDDYISNKQLTLTDVRTLTRNNIDELNLTLNSANIDDYYFVGWYKDYQSLNNLGTKVSAEESYLLDNNEMFSGNIYTAVYKKIYAVNYYNTEGEILYTVNISQNEERSFVKNAIDAEGNSVLTAIDYEAFEVIYTSLSLNEIFKNWQWVKNDGTIVKWEDFYNQTIIEDMNLYPVINRINITTTENIALDLVGSDTKDPDVILGSDKTSVIASLNMLYTYPTAIVTVEELGYYGAAVNITPAKNINITFYPNNLGESEIIGEETTDVNGVATFTFRGTLTLSKNDVGKDDIFIFKIATKDEPNNIINTLSIKSAETITLKVPYGEYIIYEDSSWAWRYKELDSQIITINNYNDDTLNFENKLINQKWFDNFTIKSNEYN